MDIGIDIDLAAPEFASGPPSAHLLAPVALCMVLLPGLLAASLHLWANSLAADAVALEQRVAEADAAAAKAADEHSRIVAMRGLVAAADTLRRDANAMQALVPSLLDGLPPSVVLGDLRLLPDEVLVSGRARTAADLAAWLETVADSPAWFDWAPAELHQVSSGTVSTVEFRLRGHWSGIRAGRTP